MNLNHNIENTPANSAKFIGLLAILTAALYAGILAGTSKFIGDAIGYRFMISPEPNEFTTDYIGSAGEIWTSQVNHWFTTNGRFICHFIVQIFCSLLPEWVWGVADGVAYGLLVVLLCRTGGRYVNAGLRCWIGLFSFLIMFRSPDFNPPLEINYPWAIALEIGFIYLFLHKPEHSSPLKWIGWVLLSICAGQWNEAFAIPIGGALIVLFCFRKGRFSAWEWSGAILFGLAALTLCLAPGNFVRMSNLEGQEPNVAEIGQRLIFALWPLVSGCLIALILYGRKALVSYWTHSGENRDVRIIIASTVIISYGLGFALKFSSGNRVVAASVVAILYMIMRMTAYFRIRKTGLWIVIAAGALSACLTAAHAKRSDFRYELYDSLYRHSPDGRIYVDSEVLGKDWYDARFNAFFFRYDRIASEGSAPPMKILPTEALSVPEDSDYNAVVPLRDGVWLLICSRENPAEFHIRRRVGIPGTSLTAGVSDRVVDFFSKGADIPVDTLKRVYLGLYVNGKPYLESEPYIYSDGD